MRKCDKHPDSKIPLATGECAVCWLERKRAEICFNNLLKPFTLAEVLKRDVPERLLNDVLNSPVKQTERILAGKEGK